MTSLRLDSNAIYRFMAAGSLIIDAPCPPLQYYQNSPLKYSTPGIQLKHAERLHIRGVHRI